MADMPGTPTSRTPPPDKPSQKPSSSSPKSTPPSISLQTLTSWAPLYLHKADVTVAHLSRALATPSGVDTLLLTLGYTTLLASSTLSSISLLRIRQLAQRAIASAVALPPNTTVLFVDAASSGSSGGSIGSKARHLVIPTSRLLVTAKRLKALSSLISDFRIFARLFGLVGIWTWGRAVFVTSPPPDAVVRRIAQLEVLVNVCFQVLENGAYLASKGVLGWTPERQNRAWLWSTRFWMAHVGLEFARLGREYAVRGGEVGTTEEERRKDGGHGAVSTGRAEREWLVKWRREVLVNGAWAPLTLHWSLEEGLMGDFWVGVFGSVAGVVGLGQLWKRTAEV